MDNFKEKVIIANNELDFITNDESNFSARYIILYKSDSKEDEEILNATICGLTLAEWVAMACNGKPVFLRTSGQENVLDLIRPYVNEKEYLVVLYANTPLLTKTHLNDLLSYVSRRRFNACKLKKGYILRGDFVLDAETIYSSYVYDLATNDFFEVNSLADLDSIRQTLEKRVFSYHTHNGVIFNNYSSTNIDAGIVIGSGSEIFGGVTIAQNSTIGKNSKIYPNTVIINSKIEDNCVIHAGTIIENSIIKTGTEIQAGTNIIHSIINENVKIGNSAKIVDSAINMNACVENFANIDSASVNSGAVIGKFSSIVGIGVTVVVDENSKVPAFSEIVKFDK